MYLCPIPHQTGSFSFFSLFIQYPINSWKYTWSKNREISCVDPLTLNEFLLCNELKNLWVKHAIISLSLFWKCNCDPALASLLYRCFPFFFLPSSLQNDGVVRSLEVVIPKAKSASDMVTSLPYLNEYFLFFVPFVSMGHTVLITVCCWEVCLREWH